MRKKPLYDQLYEAMTRFADPEDEIHLGVKGPWQELAQTLVIGRPIRDDEWWVEAGRLSVDMMIANRENLMRDAPLLTGERSLLSERNKSIYAARLYGESFKDIASEFKVTPSRASSIFAAVRQRLREMPGHASAFERWRLVRQERVSDKSESTNDD